MLVLTKNLCWDLLGEMNKWRMWVCLKITVPAKIAILRVYPSLKKPMSLDFLIFLILFNSFVWKEYGKHGKPEINGVKPLGVAGFSQQNLK